jgi:hypothetical protein
MGPRSRLEAIGAEIMDLVRADPLAFEPDRMRVDRDALRQHTSLLIYGAFPSMEMTPAFLIDDGPSEKKRVGRVWRMTGLLLRARGGPAFCLRYQVRGMITISDAWFEAGLGESPGRLLRMMGGCRLGSECDFSPKAPTEALGGESEAMLAEIAGGLSEKSGPPELMLIPSYERLGLESDLRGLRNKYGVTSVKDLRRGLTLFDRLEA